MSIIIERFNKIQSNISKINNPSGLKIIAISKIIHGENLRLKVTAFNEKVGILLIIIRPIINKLMIFKYGFLKNKKSNSNTIKTGKRQSPAAPGEGTPTK